MSTFVSVRSWTLAALVLPLAVHAEPPVAPVKSVTNEYFGKSVTDQYRYMEDLTSPVVQQWAKDENTYTRSLLDALPGRQKLRARMSEIDATGSARIGSVKRLPNGMLFYEMRGPNDDQFKVYMRQGLHGVERLLIDPQAMGKATGTSTAVNFYQPSESGRYVAFGVSQGGSEEAAIHVLDTTSMREIDTPIDRAHYSDAAWLPDDSGFFYMRQRELRKGTPETEKYRYQSAYFHRLGDKGPDTVIITAGESRAIGIAPEEFPNVTPIADTPYIAAVPQNGVQNEFSLYITERTEVLRSDAHWRQLFSVSDNITGFAIHGDDLYLLSHMNAPHYKVLRTSLARPDPDHAETIVAPGREIITGVQAAKDALYITARDGTIAKLYRLAYAHGSKPVPVALPLEGSLEVQSADPRLPGLLISMASWIHDITFFDYDAKARHFVDTGLQPIGPFGAPDNITSREVLVKSHDGVEVPLSIVYPKGIKLDGSHPVYLYGYGAYGITDDPVYVPRFLAWHELGGVRAICHVRGGGAYGEEWHLAGKQETKPNTWKDFIACAEYLVAQGYTTSARLGIHGGSAGGILIGRSLTERPDLFAAAVSEVGELNALRGEFSANGIPNIPEFGSVKDEKQFFALYEMDAVQHVADSTPYPATLIVHGINDPRVPPWESFKFAARLQAATSADKPILLRLDYDGGHGVGSTKGQRQELYADIWGFMLWQFGDPRFQPAH